MTAVTLQEILVRSQPLSVWASSSPPNGPSAMLEAELIQSKVQQRGNGAFEGHPALYFCALAFLCEVHPKKKKEGGSTSVGPPPSGTELLSNHQTQVAGDRRDCSCWAHKSECTIPTSSNTAGLCFFPLKWLILEGKDWLPPL